MKDLGNAQKILGIQIFRNMAKNQICLSRVDYTEKVIGIFSMENSKPTPISLRGHLELTKDECPFDESDMKEMSEIPYDVVIGSVVY